MTEEEKLKVYKIRLRVFLILYVFGEPCSDSKFINARKIFQSEQRIQKIDFLLRNPDYLCYELILLVKANPAIKEEVRLIVKEIFKSKEPTFKRQEMERFFFGAYEDIDDAIAFLKSIGFIEFSSRKRTDLKVVIEKKYYVNQYAIDKFLGEIDNLPSLRWYLDRCHLIKKYFGNLSGNQLRISQYRIKEYKNTSFNEYIGSIKEEVSSEFYNLYLENL